MTASVEGTTKSWSVLELLRWTSDHFDSLGIETPRLDAECLLAHVLAVAALAKGDDRGVWLSAAALDRYLQEIGRPQVFGTQYARADEDSPWTQEPLTDLLGDRMRAVFGVRSRVESEERLREMNSALEER